MELAGGRLYLFIPLGGTLWLMVVAVAAVGVGSEQVAAAIEMVVADEGSEGAAAGVCEQGSGFIAGVDNG